VKLNQMGLDLAELENQRRMQAGMIQGLSINIARTVYEQLVLDAGREQIAKCKSELAKKKTDPTHSPDLSMEIDFGPILTIAQAAAENFLGGMGLIKPREEKPGIETAA